MLFAESQKQSMRQHSEEDTSPVSEAGPVFVPGQIIENRYHLESYLGAGGFSTVYRAKDMTTRKIVAVKVIALSRLEESEQAKATFDREIELLSRLKHPYFPRIYDHFMTEECCCLVMDYIDGKTLEYYLDQPENAPLPLKGFFTLALLLCEALEYLHSLKPPVVFRDLKPANIMLTRDNRLYLIDFGIARRYRAGQILDTTPLGSPGYAAPEQYGYMQTTPRTDVYSLGVLLYYLLSGDDPSRADFVMMPLPGKSTIHKALAELIEKMTVLNVEKRPSVKGVREQLQRQMRAYYRQVGARSTSPRLTSGRRSESGNPRTGKGLLRQTQPPVLYEKLKYMQRTLRARIHAITNLSSLRPDMLAWISLGLAILGTVPLILSYLFKAGWDFLPATLRLQVVPALMIILMVLAAGAGMVSLFLRDRRYERVALVGTLFSILLLILYCTIAFILR